MWTRGTDGTNTRYAKEYHKDHHSQQFCLPLRLELLSVKDCTSTRHLTWLTRTTSPCGKKKPGKLSKSWDSLTSALSKAGLEMKPSKCTAWRPHDPGNSEPVIPGIKVDTGLIVLAVDGSEMPLGVPMQDESNLANDPTTARADKACKLAKGITDMARAMVDKCGAHAATVLLQRVCLSLSRLWPPSTR